MSRQLTAAELTTLRTRPIRSQLYLATQKPRTVWTSTIAVAPTSDDQATQFTANDNWTLATEASYFGSTIKVTNAGVLKGYARLRTCTNASAVIGIGETSEIDWAVGDVVEVLDEFLIWPRAIREVDETTVYIDEIAYVAQHTTCAPVPVLGPNLVVRLSGGSVMTYWDASDSWEPNGGACTYSWSVRPAGEATITDGATATPTIEFDQAKCYQVICAVTCGGVTSYGHRFVFVLPETGWTSEDDSYLATPSFTMSSCTGSYDDGGWTANITLYDANTEDIHERGLCVLCSDDWHGSTQQNVGLYTGNYAAGRNNIILSGWLGDERVAWNPDRGSVEFEIWGTHRWLDKVTNYPVGIFDTDFPDLPAGTSDWLQFNDLTVDKGLWHMLYWRSTLCLVCDAYLTGDTRQIGVAEAPVGTLWRQIVAMAEDTILARPACDKLGRLFIRIDQQYVAVVSRAITDVYANSAAPLGIHRADWRDTVVIQTKRVMDASQVDSSGISYLDGAAAAYWSLAHGHIPAHYGTMQSHDRLLLVDQAQANTLCGLLWGQLNNKYPNTTLPLAHLQKVTDICPAQCVTMVIAAADTERGLEWPDDDDDAAGLSAKRLIPRRISYNWDAAQGVLLPDLECEAESWPGLSVTGDPPPAPPDPPPPTLPPLPPLPPYIPPANPVVAFAMTSTQLARTGNFDEAAPNWTNVKPAGITGDMMNISLQQDGVGHRVFLFENTGNMANNNFGNVWRCNNGLGASPSFSIIYSSAQILAALQALPQFTFNDPIWGFMFGGVMARDNTLRFSVQAYVLTYNAALKNERFGFDFFSTDFGATWTIGWWVNSAAALVRYNAGTASVNKWDEWNGYRLGGGSAVVPMQEGSCYGAAVAAAAGENVVPDNGIQFYPNWLIRLSDGSCHASADNSANRWTGDGGAGVWTDTGETINTYAGGHTNAYDDYFYIRDDVGGEASRLYRNGAELFNSTDGWADNTVYLCKPYSSSVDGDKVCVVRRDVNPALPAKYIAWTADAGATIEDKYGDFATAIGAWAGATNSGNVYGNAMCLFFEDGVELD